jgi:hypothetical protein
MFGGQETGVTWADHAPLPPAAAEATFYEAAIAARPKLGQDGVLSPEKK